MVRDAMARDRRIGMIQPRDEAQVPALFSIGCVGRISNVEALDDGRFNIVLTGIARFRVLRELDVSTPFRQVEAELTPPVEESPLAPAERAALELEARRFADQQGYMIDWNAVTRLDDASLVNGIAQVAPFDPAAKQSLLEAADLRERMELTIQLMRFFGRADENGGTMQ
jgi:Lon protease-like protein